MLNMDLICHMYKYRFFEEDRQISDFLNYSTDTILMFAADRRLCQILRIQIIHSMQCMKSDEYVQDMVLNMVQN